MVVFKFKFFVYTFVILFPNYENAQKTLFIIPFLPLNDFYDHDRLSANVFYHRAYEEVCREEF
jgi:hypothetical protein